MSDEKDEGQTSIIPALDSMSKVAGNSNEKYDPSSPELQKDIDRALRRAEIKGLLNYADLPAPWQLNEYIRHGYRFTKSHWATAGSPFCLHNETTNIWTHAIAALIILFAFPLYISPLPTWYGPGGYADVAMAATYFLCFGGCMVCSILWHTAKCSSSPTAIVTFVAVDVLSISLACSSFNFASVYCAFYQESAWLLRLYLAIAGTWCAVGMVLPFTSVFESPDKAVFRISCCDGWLPATRTWIRTLYFCSMLATGTLIPMAHATYLHGWDASVELYSHCVPVLAPPFVGAMIYATKFPESLFPERFDYIGSSHNLWHVCSAWGGINGCIHIRYMLEIAWARLAESTV
ncbi:inc metabolism membrane protein [Diatrype stigma]|uniref:Inc metabolism membrane protein n=1 Tax=Diatrype stigma TaxID=117547 RepID=A0AAN9UV23_9PEZI